jgi:hypothetical protein
MTRKDYTLIAAELKRSQPSDPNALRGFALAVEAVARAFQRDNGRFDAERFYSAVWGDAN